MAPRTYPELIVGAVIFNHKGEIFLMKSQKWRNNYVIPGGHVELGERLEDAIRREIKEETGLDAYDFEFICLKESIFDRAFWKKKHFIFIDYACRADSTNAKLNCEGQGYVWVSLHEALKRQIDPYTKYAIEQYIRTHPETNS